MQKKSRHFNSHLAANRSRKASVEETTAGGYRGSISAEENCINQACSEKAPRAKEKRKKESIEAKYQRNKLKRWKREEGFNYRKEARKQCQSNRSIWRESVTPYVRKKIGMGKLYKKLIVAFSGAHSKLEENSANITSTLLLHFFPHPPSPMRGTTEGKKDVECNLALKPSQGGGTDYKAGIFPYIAIFFSQIHEAGGGGRGRP